MRKSDIQIAMDLLRPDSSRGELHAAFEALHMHKCKSAELELEAVAVVKRIPGFVLAPAKDFLRKLADFLNWQDLKKEL